VREGGGGVGKGMGNEGGGGERWRVGGENRWFSDVGGEGRWKWGGGFR